MDLIACNSFQPTPTWSTFWFHVTDDRFHCTSSFDIRLLLFRQFTRLLGDKNGRASCGKMIHCYGSAPVYRLKQNRLYPGEVYANYTYG